MLNWEPSDWDELSKEVRVGVSEPDDEVQVLDRGRRVGAGRVNTGTAWPAKRMLLEIPNRGP
jgi:hypothetical protein